MNSAKLVEAERGLSVMARKVLDATPKGPPASLHEVMKELHQAGSNPEQSVVLGCLNTLTKAGLVREPEPKMFTRVTPRAILTVASAGKQTEDAAPSVEKDTLAKIADLAAAVREASRALAAVATQLEDVALEVEDRIGKAGEGAEKLKQLQELLRSIGS